MGEDNVRSIAVIDENLPFVPVFQVGNSYICPITVCVKLPDMPFNKNTRVLTVSKEGNVSVLR